MKRHYINDDWYLYNELIYHKCENILTKFKDKLECPLCNIEPPFEVYFLAITTDTFIANSFATNLGELLTQTYTKEFIKDLNNLDSFFKNII